MSNKFHHKFKLYQEVYLNDCTHINQKATITGLLAPPGYATQYTILIGSSIKKKYRMEEDLTARPLLLIETRKELYEKIGPEATKVIRELRDQGKIDINLPPNTYRGY